MIKLHMLSSFLQANIDYVLDSASCEKNDIMYNPDCQANYQQRIEISSWRFFIVLHRIMRISGCKVNLAMPYELSVWLVVRNEDIY